MNILIPGKKPSERVHVADCDGCGCRFEFNETECTVAGGTACAKCPCCSAEVWVARPGHMRDLWAPGMVGGGFGLKRTDKVWVGV